MDDFFQHAGNARTAVVVRQFSPARIERALLAQVFELVCGQRGESEESGTSRDPNRPRLSPNEVATESPEVGRHAA